MTFVEWRVLAGLLNGAGRSRQDSPPAILRPAMPSAPVSWGVLLDLDRIPPLVWRHRLGVPQEPVPVMAKYTQQELDTLISSAKTIADPPKKEFRVGDGHKRNDMTLVDDSGRPFAVFIRINETFEECFSIGLRYLPQGDSAIVLLRCNGPHGGFAKSLIETHPHYGFHIHRASSDMIEASRTSEANAELTTAYGDYNSALRHFLKMANIRWNESHFPGLKQKTLFTDDHDGP